MPYAYSTDLRQRVIGWVDNGESRRGAAEQFEISPSAAIKWFQRWCTTGSILAKPRGGSVSPLEEHAAVLLALNVEQPDLTLDEVVVVLFKRGIKTSRSALSRFFNRHGITFKKKHCTQPNKNGLTSLWLAAGGLKVSACLTRPIWFLLTRRLPIPKWHG